MKYRLFTSFKRSFSQLSLAFLASCERINRRSKSIKIHWRAVMATKNCCKLTTLFCCEMYILMWQVVTSKTYTLYAFGLWKVSNASHKDSPLRSFWTTKTPNQKEFYELYVIQDHKFGAKKNCTSENKLVSAVMNLKTQSDCLILFHWVSEWMNEWVTHCGHQWLADMLCIYVS